MTSILENHVFQNQQVPQSVMILSKLMPDIGQSVLSPILKLVVDIVEKKNVPSRAIEKLYNKLNLKENGDHLFCGLMMLIQAIVRLPQDSIKENDLRQGLKELKFTDECCSEFLTIFNENKVNLYSAKYNTCSFFFKIEKFEWRIDITVSSNYQAQAYDTVIIFKINFKNAGSKSFEVSIAKFHQLRFYVSSMLKEMEFLEKKSVFK